MPWRARLTGQTTEPLERSWIPETNLPDWPWTLAMINCPWTLALRAKVCVPPFDKKYADGVIRRSLASDVIVSAVATRYGIS